MAPEVGVLQPPTGGRIEYLDLGAGQPMLVIPGGEDGVRTVGEASRALRWTYRERARRFRVIVVGRREPVPCDGDPRVLAADCAWAIEVLGVGPLVVEGISAGGPVATWLAVDRPGLVRGLVLTATFARVDEPLERILREWIRLALEGKWRELVADSLDRARPASAHPRKPALPPAVRLLSEPRSPDRFVRIMGGLVASDLRPELPKVRAPAIVLGGAEDQIVRPPLVEELAAGIPGSRLALFPGWGHGLFRGSPEYETAVERFARV